MIPDYITTMPREQQDRSSKIRTFTGKYVDPVELDPADVEVRDIAHHLAAINRYTGATPDPYNVAQHSVIVAGYFRHMGWMERAAALFHDGSEYVLNDIASPVKRNTKYPEYGGAYQKFEARAMEAIFDAVGIDRKYLVSVHGGPIKAIDDLVFHREAASWWGTIGFRDRIIPVSSRTAEKMFLNEYEDILRAKRRGETK